jgi:hypothetical protein
MKWVLVIMMFGGASGGAAVDTRVEFVSQRAEDRCNEAAAILNKASQVVPGPYTRQSVIAKCIQVAG